MEHGVKEVAYGLKIKRQNETLSLGVLAVAAFIWHHIHAASEIELAASFGLGLLWANWFEYAYHRWFDHDTIFGSFFKNQHRDHHEKPQSGCHINFGKNPFWSLVTYAMNSIPVVLVDLFFVHSGFSSAVLAAFVLYVVLIEEMHWRIHTDQWLPFGIGRRHHLQHHGTPAKNFNVCFPVFDWIFRTQK